MDIDRLLNIFSFIEALASAGLILIILFRRKPAAKNTAKFVLGWFLLIRRHPWIAFLLIGLLGFTASALLTVFAGTPQPAVHDEFSYLLAADTFGHGRLTNPTHPLWKHFETFHVIQHPTYASRYPAAQGLSLALGQVIFGYPIVGVWLSVGLACAAICWMLAGWCPLRWAWIGGLVAVVRLVFSGPFSLSKLSTFAYWSQSYWGGTVAVLGGALVFGALPRVIKKQRLQDALWLGIGLAILANSRPFEGLIASVPVALVLGTWMIRTKYVSWRVKTCQVVLPVVLVLLLTASWMGFYNFRVTGDPFRMPYKIYETTYEMVTVFLWQPLRAEQQYNHEIMREFSASYVSDFLYERTLKGWIKKSIKVATELWLFYGGIIFIPPILLLATSRRMWRTRNVIFPVGIGTLVMAALLTETWFFPHYTAPVACLAFLFLVECLREARHYTWRGKPVGQQYVGAVLLVLFASAVAQFTVAHYLKPPSSWNLDRARIMRDLEQSPERHLVIVRYDPNHSPHDEWVYNKAEIDKSKVVWAREMGPRADRELIDYFRDRRIWLLKADELPRHLISYKGAL